MLAPHTTRSAEVSGHFRFGVLCASFILLAFAVGELSHLQGGVSALERTLEASPTMQTLTTSWQDAEGVTHTVTTPRLDGEAVGAWIARHREAVGALQKAFPPGN